MTDAVRTTTTTTVGGVPLCFDEWEGSGPPVIFLHATGFSRGCWRPAAEQLTDVCRPVAVDLRGHGGSPELPGPYEWASLADDIAALVAERWQEPVVLVGHSVGGAAAVEVAARFDLPIAQLVLFEPMLQEGEVLGPDQRDPGALSPLVKRTQRRRAEWDSRAAAIDYLRERVPYSLWDPTVYLAWTDTGLEDTETGARLSCSPTVEAAVFITGRGSRARELLSDVTCPTWIVRATGDRGMESTCPPSAPAALSDGVDFGVEGSGHFLPLERPDLVVATLRHALLLRSGSESAAP